MDVRVREAEISALHVWHASMVLLARPGESVGIPIYETLALASASDSGDAPYHLLVIEVDDPSDETTQARVRANLRSFGL